MINTYNLFAVQLTHLKVPLDLNTHKKIISFVENKYKEKDTISCIKGFQFHKDFDGKKELNNHLNIYLKNTVYQEIIHGWLNVLGNNSYNRPHYHTGDNLRYSGVYYLSNENNALTFVRNDETFEIKPKMFDLLIFPIDLVHYVLPETRLEKRICYAFNLQSIRKDNNV